jgi:hypothetical protein
LVQKRWDHGNAKQQNIQPKLSTIFKQKILDIPQAFGSFVDDDGEKYCAVSAIIKYLGYDIFSSSITTTKKLQNNENKVKLELIPSYILEAVEDFAPGAGIIRYPPKCFCSKPHYYSYSLITLLLHLNDYHKMTFMEIGNWLESKGM